MNKWTIGPQVFEAYSQLLEMYRRSEKPGVAQMEKVLKLMREEWLAQRAGQGRIYSSIGSMPIFLGTRSGPFWYFFACRFSLWIVLSRQWDFHRFGRYRLCQSSGLGFSPIFVGWCHRLWASSGATEHVASPITSRLHIMRSICNAHEIYAVAHASMHDACYAFVSMHATQAVIYKYIRIYIVWQNASKGNTRERTPFCIGHIQNTYYTYSTWLFLSGVFWAQAVPCWAI